MHPIESSVKTLLKWGVSPTADTVESKMHRSNVKRRMSKISLVGLVQYSALLVVVEVHTHTLWNSGLAISLL
jgi:CTP synthase (UTP-ammonia lyase)